MKDMIEHIADRLVSDHVALMEENKRLRDALEERKLDYNLLAEQYRELLEENKRLRDAAIRARGGE